jgi:hypothetical protein
MNEGLLQLWAGGQLPRRSLANPLAYRQVSGFPATSA